MRKKWVGWFTALAALALLLPITPWFGANNRDNGGDNVQITKTKALSAKKERALKLASLQRDMNATAKLCTLQCSKELGKMLAKDHSGPGLAKHLQKMMKQRPQLRYVQQVGAASPVSAGSVAPDLKERAEGYLAKARTEAGSGRFYESPVFMTDGERYVVLGVPRRPGNRSAGMIALIRQDTVGDVQKHQMRNLRLVPYPAEGHYRMESVQSGTMKDMTVREGEDNGNASHYHINEVVVRFQRDPSEAQMQQIRSDIGAAKEQKLGKTFVFRSRQMDARNMMAYFQKRWKPEYVEPHYLYLTNDIKDGSKTLQSKVNLPAKEDQSAQAAGSPIVPNDVLYSKYQWNLPSIETERGWNVSKGDTAVSVGVLDTGVQADHPDLKGKLLGGTNIVEPGSAPADDVGHGTHVSGIIAAGVNNGEGVAGISWYNKVMPVKVLDSSGAGSTYSVAQGIIWATDHGAKVINMSLGNYAQAAFLHDAIKYAYNKDVVLIAASGNDNTDRPGYPAAYPEVLAVAATDANGRKASFSNYGSYIDVAAPGDTIASTYPGNEYAALSGTSMASPHAAALAALIRSKNPELTNVEVMDLMRNTARDLGPEGKDDYFGYGQIDVVRALEAAETTGKSLQTFSSRAKARLSAIAQRYENANP
ncbi:S8 family peptidase [Paenibacillus beijingensis]|uniref:Serine protease n=1 Tax=Paenibacillus beijingensis TaxID=1126833 RepID=A0A0D5NLY4_9BACL|nr:S8 family peptidase [Paenibacillus beijingensis]AJY76339.1 serine protease [Paenibacillus beijingensis]